VKWLLDTNVVSETVGARRNRTVTQWLDGQSKADTAISLVTLGELQHGVFLAPEANRAELADWIDGELVPGFKGRILPISLDIVVNWLELTRILSRRRQTRSAADLLIAATARVHNLTVATRNTRDFANTSITVYNPWTNETHHMEAP
jgi:predicted nucleic acid-binding protein